MKLFPLKNIMKKKILKVQWQEYKIVQTLLRSIFEYVKRGLLKSE